MQAHSAAGLRGWRHHGFYAAPPCAETPTEQPVPGAADFFAVAGRQILVIRPVDGVASLGQDLYDGSCHPVGRSRERHVDQVRLMGDGRAGAGGDPDDQEGEAEAVKLADHAPVLSFKR